MTYKTSNSKKIFALVDGNSFYCSCERVFNPALARKPVIVLSNNDGCAVSRTDEAKALGIEMGAVFYKIKHLVQKHDIHVFSSNYTLYGDMSARMMNILSEFVPQIEIYSIDEAFLDLSGMSQWNLTEYAQTIRQTVLQQIGIPTCVGVGPTKVLAKVGNKLAKKNKEQTQGVVNLCDERDRDTALKKLAVEDIWGVGRKSAEKLRRLKIYTAYELQQADPEKIRKVLTVVGARLVEELRGLSCIDLETDIEDRKQIVSSRSFGRAVTAKTEVQESLANHVSTAAEKLRKQNLLCRSLTLFIQTNPFKIGSPQYFNSATIRLMSGTSVTSKLIRQAFHGLDHIFRDGYEYKKAGVILNDLVKKDAVQTDFFEQYDQPEEDHLMSVIDAINQYHGQGTIKFAACGIHQFWKMLSEMKTPCYTTRLTDLKCVP